MLFTTAVFVVETPAWEPTGTLRSEIVFLCKYYVVYVRVTRILHDESVTVAGSSSEISRVSSVYIYIGGSSDRAPTTLNLSSRMRQIRGATCELREMLLVVDTDGHCRH